jgi:hypothetical protein
MATKTLGYTANNPSYMAWRLSNVGHIIGLRALMPENGRLKSIKMKLGRYNSSNNPIVWGVVYNRSNGQRIAMSSSQNPSNVATGTSSLQDYIFNFNDEFVSGGTNILIGLARDSSVNRGLCFGFRHSAGGYTELMNGTYTSPVNTYSESGKLADVGSSDTLWVELTYETGGQLKVYTGAVFADAPAKVYNGSSWIDAFVKVFDGSNWVDSK